MASVKHLGTLALLPLLVHCGDPQIDQQVRGVPIYTFTGNTMQSGMPPPGNGLRLALFWSPRGLNVQDPEQWVEQVGTSTPFEMNANWALNIFETPGPEHMLMQPDGTSAGYAAGRILVYADA